ncbi:hypothetical protein PROFUN_03406 [Planoprotostelium fungivorum]|uniref:Calcineurin-like phosphoesterase domain-containing protein n=1 Tax=Planoprotostelium fungivorum TaxID=1890364 RepID=A0A2P6NWG1_9EUKA|nr:hypothetical protein PROFUN_03406 [Planoprotostelium fungivorum]
MLRRQQNFSRSTLPLTDYDIKIFKLPRTIDIRPYLAIWFLLLMCGECLMFVNYASRCKIDQRMPATSQVLIVADPQLSDLYSYSFAPRDSLLLKVVQFYNDIYVRRAWQMLIRRSTAEHVLFLGDLFDTGKRLSEDEYRAELARFNEVFAMNTERGSDRFTFTPGQHLSVWNMSGNHDIGYMIAPYHQKLAIGRFKKYFGPLNWRTTIRDHEVIAINTLTLDPEMTDSEAHQESRDFLDTLKKEDPRRPRILLTHVPLWRPPNSDCGASGGPPIVDRVGYSYTNMLTREISEELLSLRPMLVLSGDNHHHCDYVHPNGILERTVGTLSWLQGIDEPSITVLNVHDRGEKDTASRPTLNVCRMPKQMDIYWAYTIVGITSFIVMVVRELMRSPSYNESAKVIAFQFTKLVICVLSFYTFLLWAFI